MSNQGIRGFYQITDTIKDNLLNDINVNTVTTGDITDIDLSKQTIFPLSHIMINSVTTQEQVLSFNITIMAMDIVDISKENKTDIFTGDPTCEPFYERFENQLAGWACTMNILIENDISSC